MSRDDIITVIARVLAGEFLDADRARVAAKAIAEELDRAVREGPVRHDKPARR